MAAKEKRSGTAFFAELLFCRHINFSTLHILLVFAQTYIGPVVVSVNPYQPVRIYTAEHVEEYRSRNSYELPPHM